MKAISGWGYLDGNGLKIVRTTPVAKNKQGKAHQGEANGRAKLTAQQALEIYEALW